MISGDEIECQKILMSNESGKVSSVLENAHHLNINAALLAWRLLCAVRIEALSVAQFPWWKILNLWNWSKIQNGFWGLFCAFQRSLHLKRFKTTACCCSDLVFHFVVLWLIILKCWATVQIVCWGTNILRLHNSLQLCWKIYPSPYSMSPFFKICLVMVLSAWWLFMHASCHVAKVLACYLNDDRDPRCLSHA